MTLGQENDDSFQVPNYLFDLFSVESSTFFAAFIESGLLCVMVEVGRAPFRLCYLGVWYHKSALQLSACSLTVCSFMAFTTDISLHIVCVLILEYHKVQSWAPRFAGQQSS